MFPTHEMIQTLALGYRRDDGANRLDLDSPDDPSPCREEPYLVDEGTEEGDHDPELPVPVFLGFEGGYVGAVDGGEGVDDRAGV